MILLLRWWGGWRDFDIQGLEQVCVRRRQGNGVPRLQGSDSQVGLYPPFSFSTLQASSCFPNPGTLLPETSSLTTTRTPKYQILASPGVSIKSQGERSKIFFCRNLRDLGGEMYEQKTKGALPIRWMIIIIFTSTITILAKQCFTSLLVYVIGIDHQTHNSPNDRSRHRHCHPNKCVSSSL